MGESLVPLYSNPDTNIKSLIDSGYIVVMDTNVLLNPYRVSPDFADFILKCIRVLEDAIRIPRMVWVEVNKHHMVLFNTRKKSLDDILEERAEKVELYKEKTLNSLSFLAQRSFPDAEDILNDIACKYKEIEDLLKNYCDNHKVLDVIYDTWESDLPFELYKELVNKGYLFPELPAETAYHICESGERRYEKQIPPGYKDKKDKDGMAKYMDLIIWNEILMYAKASGKDIIFVTDDIKEDWWMAENNKYRFRTELVEEFTKYTVQRNEDATVTVERKMIPFCSRDFFSAVSRCYGIEQTDAIQLALSAKNDEYIDSIAQSVFEDIQDELVFSGSCFLDDSITHIGTEQILDWEIENFCLISYELVYREAEEALYELEYEVTMSGESFDYWGRDDDTKEVILSPPYRHTVKGRVILGIDRKVTSWLDYDYDRDYRNVILLSASFSEESYHDCFDGESPDW